MQVQRKDYVDLEDRLRLVAWRHIRAREQLARVRDEYEVLGFSAATRAEVLEAARSRLAAAVERCQSLRREIAVVEGLLT